MPSSFSQLKRKYADALAVPTDDLPISLFADAKKCVKGIPCKNTCINASYICKPPKMNKTQTAYAEAVVASSPDTGAPPLTAAEADEFAAILINDLDKSAAEAFAIEKKANPYIEDDWALAEPAITEPQPPVSAPAKASSENTPPPPANSLAKALSKNAPPPTNEQATAINTYTGIAYRDLNSELRGKGDPDTKEENLKLANDIADGLKELPNHKGETYRGTNLDKSIADKLKVGATYSDKGFLSTSAKSNIAEDFAGTDDKNKKAVFFTIDGTYGKNITAAAILKNESEVLFAPSSKFKISSSEEKDGALYVRMKQYGEE